MVLFVGYGCGHDAIPYSSGEAWFDAGVSFGLLLFVFITPGEPDSCCYTDFPWAALSRPLQAALQHYDLTDPVGFRGTFEGKLEEAKEMALEFGGTPENAPVLVALWEQAGFPVSQSLRAAALAYAQ